MIFYLMKIKPRGGFKDKEENEFIVFPYKIELFLTTTVIPVAKFIRTFLKFFLLFFS